MNRSNAILIFRTGFCVYLWIVIILSTIGIDDYKYFTMQSNLLVAIWLTLAVIWSRNPDRYAHIESPLHGAITMYITVTFLVYATVLAPGTPSSYFYSFTNIGLHYVVPLIMLADWLIFGSSVRYPWKMVGLWLIYPFFYLGFALWYSDSTGNPIYPFLSVAELGWGGVLVWIVMIIVLGIVLGAILVAISRARTKSQAKSN